jgi:hypothetical protein
MPLDKCLHGLLLKYYLPGILFLFLHPNFIAVSKDAVASLSEGQTLALCPECAIFLEAYSGHILSIPLLR